MASSKRDYYEILSVTRTVTSDELKKAYRKAALAHHPDRNPGDKKAEDKFKEATEAYQVLSDASKRKLYDQYGHDAVNGQGGMGGGFSSGGFEDVFEGIFEDFFGGGSSRSHNRSHRGSDLQYELEITFEEAYFGTEQTLDLRREEACATCHGDGAKPGTARKTCGTCQGSGKVLASSGFFSVARTCGRCHGLGSTIEQPCNTCRGAGRVTVDRKIQAKIPAGVDTGIRLRVSGEGEAGYRGGPRGDLYVDIHVQSHEIFSRNETHILCDAPISFVQAALGAEIEVPTMVGPHSLKIPAGTQSGKVFKIKGKGFASVRGEGIGDQEVRVIVETPAHLSDKQKELLKEFASLSGEKVNPLSASFVRKVKNIFSKQG